ncbi:MAG TPA: cytochrome c oxidase subunit II transmembrane domain-containing protein, partial [Thermoleophilaceae bacterium]|nr:cytochrome c oxidase subunit II transmembrane domain-containing protein [Thermoleophilaceae bacterium]
MSGDPTVMIQRALRPCRPNRRRLSLALVLAAAALLALTPAAQAGILTPESSGSPNAEKIDLLYTITLAIAAVIFVGVEGVLIWSLVKFRFRRGDREPAQIRGNAPLEIGWTVGAASILVVLTVLTFVYLDDIVDPVASGPEGLAGTGAPERVAGMRAPDGNVQFAAVDQSAP